MSAAASEARNRPRQAAGGVLDRYVLRRFAAIYAATLVCFSLTYIVLDLFENLDEWSRQADGLADLLAVAVAYYSAVLPVVLCQVLGAVVTLTAGLFTVTVFQRGNELVPILASGRSMLRLLAPLLAGALAIALGTFAVQELWIPGMRATLRDVSGRREGSNILLDQKHRDASGLLLGVQRFHVLERRGEGVTVLGLGRDRAQELVIHARSMEWVDLAAAPSREGYWLLRDGTEQRYSRGAPGARPRLETPVDPGVVDAQPRVLTTFVERALAVSLRPEDLEVRGEHIVHLSLAELAERLETSPDRGWSVRYYSRFFSPLHNLVLLVVGLPVTLYFGSRNVFFGGLVSACVSAVYFVVVAAAADLAVRGYLSGPLGAAIGPLGFFAAGITWLRFVRS